MKEGRKFKPSYLFDAQNGDTDIQKKDINGNGHEVVSAGLLNCGFIGRSDKKAKTIPAETITIDMFGNAFYRDISYKMVTHARVFALLPKFEMNELIGLYLTTRFKFLHKMFSYSNMCSWNKVKKYTILLPIKTDSTGKPIIDQNKTYHPDGYIPDWEYMEKYIKATEKEVIKEVVLYKDEMIKKMKEITGEE